MESRLAASLDHPNVVPIYDAGDVESQLYLAMRYVEGQDLKRLLAQEGKLEPGRAIAICSQVADALDAAHARKPSAASSSKLRTAASAWTATGRRWVRPTSFGSTPRAPCTAYRHSGPSRTSSRRSTAISRRTAPCRAERIRLARRANRRPGRSADQPALRDQVKRVRFTGGARPPGLRPLRTRRVG